MRQQVLINSRNEIGLFNTSAYLFVILGVEETRINNSKKNCITVTEYAAKNVKSE